MRRATLGRPLGGRRDGDAIGAGVGGLPPAPGRATLVLPDGTSSTVVLEAVVTGIVVLTAPRYAGDLEPPHPGTPMTLTWCSPRGRHEVGLVMAEHLPGRVPLWRLLLTGDPESHQRRSFARARGTVPLLVTWSASTALVPMDDAAVPSGPESSDPLAAGTTPGEPLPPVTRPASSIDISEAAVLCRLHDGVPDQHVDGDAVAVALHLPERLVEVSAALTRRPDRGESHALLVLTAVSPDVAALMRRTVLAWQRGERALRS